MLLPPPDVDATAPARALTRAWDGAGSAWNSKHLLGRLIGVVRFHGSGKDVAETEPAHRGRQLRHGIHADELAVHRPDHRFSPIRRPSPAALNEETAHRSRLIVAPGWATAVTRARTSAAVAAVSRSPTSTRHPVLVHLRLTSSRGPRKSPLPACDRCRSAGARDGVGQGRQAGSTPVTAVPTADSVVPDGRLWRRPRTPQGTVTAARKPPPNAREAAHYVSPATARDA